MSCLTSLYGKNSKWVEAKPSTHSPFQKKDFGTSDQKLQNDKVSRLVHFA